jgi:hypothetical protein
LFKGDKARLISETIKKVQNDVKVCLNFWYHNYGASIGELNIYTRKRATLSAEPVWSMIGEAFFFLENFLII